MGCKIKRELHLDANAATNAKLLGKPSDLACGANFNAQLACLCDLCVWTKQAKGELCERTHADNRASTLAFLTAALRLALVLKWMKTSTVGFSKSIVFK